MENKEEFGELKYWFSAMYPGVVPKFLCFCNMLDRVGGESIRMEEYELCDEERSPLSADIYRITNSGIKFATPILKNSIDLCNSLGEGRGLSSMVAT